MSKLTKFRIGPLPFGSRLLGDGQHASAPSQPPTFEDVVQQYGRRAAAQHCLIVFDATSSMSPYWNHVCGTLRHVINRLAAVHAGISLRVVAYRDDCDGARVIERSDWSADPDVLGRFVTAVRCEGGGDWPEAVDRALQAAVDEEARVSAVILIGDAPPHEQRDGRAQAKQLRDLSRPVYPIVVGGARDTREAFEAIAILSGGRMLELDRIDELFDLLGVVLAHAAGAEVMGDYLRRFGKALGPAAQRAAKLLTDGRG